MTEQRFVELDGGDGRTRWTVDAGFLTSNWTCVWGQGCQGIHETKRPELMDGCCSVGVILTGEQEAMNIAALAATIDPARFEHHEESSVIERRGPYWATRVVDGACVMLNRPGFAGGAGCALHVAALAEGDEPRRWKPQTCGRVPIHVDEHECDDGTVEVTVRAWRRDDWGGSMAWWCTEAPEAFVGERPVIETMFEELRDIFGDTMFETLASTLRADGA